MTAFFLKYWHCSLLAMIFMVLEVSADLALPGLMAGMVDNAILGGPEHLPPNTDLVISAAVTMTGVMGAGFLCGLLSAVFANLFSIRSANLIRKALYARISGFAFGDYEHFSAGSLITRTTSDITGIQNMTAQLIRGAVRALMFLTAGSLALLLLSPDYSMVLLIALPLIILETAFILRRSRPLFEEMQEKTDLVNQTAREGLLGLDTLRSYAREDYERERFNLVNSSLARVRFRTLILLSFMHPVMNIILNMAIAGLLYIGYAKLTSGSAAEPGAVMAGVTYLALILNGLMMLVMIFQNVTRGMTSWKRVREALNQEIALQEGSVTTGKAPVEVTFHDVSFRYPGQPEDALSHISFTVKAGETLGITGSTGSGKTALASLIPRFYDPREGTVEIAGIPAREWQFASLRKITGTAFQKALIFRKSLRDNITAEASGYSEEEIQKAARNAAAHDFIMEKPRGYDTVPGSGGSGLSGGQRQRIALARALLRKPEILILDDALSALDYGTEALVLANLKREYPGMTLILISQRISALRNAGRILVLEKGSLAGLGTHEELLRTSETYRELYSTQNAGLEDAHDS